MSSSSQEARRRSRSRRRRNDKSVTSDESYDILEQRIKVLENAARNRSNSQSEASSSGVQRPSRESSQNPRSYTPPITNRNFEILSREERVHSSFAREPSHARFVGRLELIPEFDGSTDAMTINRWLDKINSVSKLYNWDDSAKIFCMIARLKGNAKSWYDCQTTTPATWLEWEEKLKNAFPPHKGIASKLKEFVNTERTPDQDIVSFYYAKLRVGKHCNLPDEVITDVIISTINNNLIKASAYAANCKTTEKLLQFLTDFDYCNTRHVNNQQKTCNQN